MLLNFDCTGIKLIHWLALGSLKIINMFCLPSVVGGRSVGRSVCFFVVVGCVVVVGSSVVVIAVNYHKLVSKCSYIYNFVN